MNSDLWTLKIETTKSIHSENMFGRAKRMECSTTVYYTFLNSIMVQISFRNHLQMIFTSILKIKMIAKFNYNIYEVSTTNRSSSKVNEGKGHFRGISQRHRLRFRACVWSNCLFVCFILIYLAIDMFRISQMMNLVCNLHIYLTDLTPSIRNECSHKIALNTKTLMRWAVAAILNMGLECKCKHNSNINSKWTSFNTSSASSIFSHIFILCKPFQCSRWKCSIRFY